MRRELLDLAADALNDGMDPLSGGFLHEHRVTADECFELAETMAAGLTLMALISDHPLLARAALDGIQLATAADKLKALVATKLKDTAKEGT